MARMSADSDPLAKRRAQYAHEVMARYGTTAPRVEAAFAKVPREAFLGPPPWAFGLRGSGPWATTSDPEALYQDELIVLDRAKGINNGQPSLHAMCIAALRLTEPDHVLHIGAGTGYYTAILAELADRVDAYEIEPVLAAKAVENLAPWPKVTVHAESAVGRTLSAADAIYVSAGASHPDPFWLDALRDGGRLLFPLTGDEGWGGMLLVERRGHSFAARFLSNCGFINCAGLRDPVSAARLTEVFRRGGKDQVRSLTRQPPPGPTVWFAGDSWYLSTEPPPEPAQ
jgi:protein-L-isoaspartate(D-aspartate) O-methyltransferase